MSSEQVQLERRAAAEFAAAPVTEDGKVSPWATVGRDAVRAVATYATKLRLSPQGRKPSMAKHAPLTINGSAYDRIRMEVEQQEAIDADTDDEPNH